MTWNLREGHKWVKMHMDINNMVLFYAYITSENTLHTNIHLLVGKADVCGLISGHTCIYIHNTVMFGAHFCPNFQVKWTKIHCKSNNWLINNNEIMNNNWKQQYSITNNVTWIQKVAVTYEIQCAGILYKGLTTQ